MKRYLLSFIFWSVCLGGAFLVQSGGEKYEDIRERIDLLNGNEAEALVAIVHANCVADISFQQNTSVHVTSLLRRYPQFRTNGVRFLVSSVPEDHRIASCYQVACGDSWNYHALQKQSGYYLYQLCRLII